MTVFERGPVRLHFELGGAADGEPVLLLAPGGMHSAHALWGRAAWDPRTALASTYRTIGMDQRNAGASSAPVSASDGWRTYAQDQLSVLDHLGIERCHVLGMCIGGPFVLGLLAAAPERFGAAVLLQPVGVGDNRPVLRQLFDDWAAALAPTHPEASAADWAEFGGNLWDGEFVLSASREQVAAMLAPMLVLMGDDVYHPSATSREIVALAPNARLVEQWKGDELLAATDAIIKDFLAAHPL